MTTHLAELKEDKKTLVMIISCLNMSFRAMENKKTYPKDTMTFKLTTPQHREKILKAFLMGRILIDVIEQSGNLDQMLLSGACTKEFHSKIKNLIKIDAYPTPQSKQPELKETLKTIRIALEI